MADGNHVPLTTSQNRRLYFWPSMASLVTNNYYEVEGILSGYATGKSLLNLLVPELFF